MPLTVRLPTLQNWSCHNCGGCCREHVITVTDAEKSRIEKLNWKGADDPPPGDGPQLLREGGSWRLAHRADGACVFLNEKGLCRIHARFGEKTKPLACRVYPYAFHPDGSGRVTVSLRYSCPSVVANKGASADEPAAGREIQTLAKEVVPRAAGGKFTAPEIVPGVRLPWHDFERLIDALDDTLAEPDAGPFVRLIRAVFWVSLLKEARVDSLGGPELDDFLSIISGAAERDAPEDLSEFDPPGGLARLHFRLRVGYYARRDTAASADAGWLDRVRLLKSAVVITRGKGKWPQLRPELPPVRFRSLDGDFGPLPPGADDLLIRYLRTKVRGVHFCGPAFYDVPFVEGFLSLALVVPVTLTFARWRAVLDGGRRRLTLTDVREALAIADHPHGYSAALGTPFVRQQMRQLMGLNEVARLIAWRA
ncbi:MAG: YkgJ family cysteine cluster protein [Planctomycetota bacterium]